MQQDEKPIGQTVQHRPDGQAEGVAPKKQRPCLHPTTTSGRKHLTSAHSPPHHPASTNWSNRPGLQNQHLRSWQSLARSVKCSLQLSSQPAPAQLAKPDPIGQVLASANIKDDWDFKRQDTDGTPTGHKRETDGTPTEHQRDARRDSAILDFISCEALITNGP